PGLKLPTHGAAPAWSPRRPRAMVEIAARLLQRSPDALDRPAGGRAEILRQLLGGPCSGNAAPMLEQRSSPDRHRHDGVGQKAEQDDAESGFEEPAAHRPITSALRASDPNSG